MIINTLVMSVILNPILLFHFFEVINYISYIIYLPRFYPPVMVYFFDGI